MEDRTEIGRLTKPVLEHVHGKRRRFLWSGFLIPPRIGGEVFVVVVGGKGGIVPRFTSPSNRAGSSRGARNSEEVIERIGFTLLEGLVRGMGRSLWRRGGKLHAHTRARDDGGGSCLRDGGGGDKIPRTCDGAGIAGRDLSRDGGGDDSGGRHFVDFERKVNGRRTRVYLE